ncbi:MAG: hypothetical protein AB7V46_19990, partial [Thermomicrobiales bacterium]
IFPMQEPAAGKPLIVEICPASTLKKYGLSLPYKGPVFHVERAQLLDRFIGRTRIRVSDEAKGLAIADSGGDAMDAIIAAEATYRAWRDRQSFRGTEAHRIEGCVFA